MEEVKLVLSWVFANLEDLLTVIALLLAAIRYLHFQWAKSHALKVLADAIEKTNAEDVKKQVAWLQENAPKSVRDVITDIVATVDESKKTPSTTLVILRELLRGIVTVQTTKSLQDDTKSN